MIWSHLIKGMQINNLHLFTSPHKVAGAAMPPRFIPPIWAFTPAFHVTLGSDIFLAIFLIGYYYYAAEDGSRHFLLLFISGFSLCLPKWHIQAEQLSLSNGRKKLKTVGRRRHAIYLRPHQCGFHARQKPPLPSLFIYNKCAKFRRKRVIDVYAGY